MKRHILKHNILALFVAALFVLVSVAALPQEAEAESKKTKTAGKEGAGLISSLRFGLPRTIRWQRVDDFTLRQAGIEQWIVDGATPKNTPARVIYQKVSPPLAPATLKEHLLKPLSVCRDIRLREFAGASKYHDQYNVEAACSQLGGADFGLLTYVSILSDSVANYLVMTEIRMPVSERAGELSGKTPSERQRAEATSELGRKMLQVIASIRVCDEKNLCI